MDLENELDIPYPSISEFLRFHMFHSKCETLVSVMACHGHGVRVQHPSKAEIRSSLEKSSAQTSRPDAAAGDLFLKPTQRWERFGQQQSYGYGSIPIDTFLMGWTSIYQLFWGSLGTRVLTHSHMYHMWRSLVSLLGTIATYCNHRNVRMPFFWPGCRAEQESLQAAEIRRGHEARSSDLELVATATSFLST